MWVMIIVVPTRKMTLKMFPENESMMGIPIDISGVGKQPFEITYMMWNRMDKSFST